MTLFDTLGIDYHDDHDKRVCKICEHNELDDLDATVCEDCNYELDTS